MDQHIASSWSSSGSESSVTSVESSPHGPSSIEAHLYYHGIRENERGPTLVFRDSSDVYEEPTGPEQYKRLMRLAAVPDDHEFGKNGLWEKVRTKVVELLDEKKIKIHCVDFVRFTWLKKKEDGIVEVEDDEDSEEDDTEMDLDYDDIPPIKPVEHGERHYTNPTIWVGVEPETLSAATAFNATKDIRAFLNELNVVDIDIAYRETLPGPGAAGRSLFAPVDLGDHRTDFIDPVSVALSLPVAGLRTTMQGTLGPFFHVGSTLYAITVRHNLFEAGTSNEEYSIHYSAPKKYVVLMGDPAFTDYLATIQDHIKTLEVSVNDFEETIATLKLKVENGVGLPQSQTDLDDRVVKRDMLRRKSDALRAFFVDLNKRWGKLSQRIIGHVAWSPPLGVGAAPHTYTRDLCVIELYKKRFTNLLGNVLSLGPEYSSTKLTSLLSERNDVPSSFKYPKHGLLILQNILTAQQITNPDNKKSLDGDHHIRHAIKRGFTTNTTVGTVSRYMSFARAHFRTGHQDSLELPIIPHEKENGTFSGAGDSGSIIVSPRGEFISLLTGGTNKGTDGADITYSTVFEWVWELVREQFPGADLYWDDHDIPAFLAA